jgi:ribosomal protein L44E
MGVSALFNPETGEVTEPETQCPHCAEHTQARLEAERDLMAVERDLRQARRETTRLRNELAKQQRNNPDSVKAEALFRYWLSRLEKNPALYTFGEKRRKVVLARLREKEATYIARAIDGLAVSAYTSPSGKRFDDLELVCRDEVKCEGFYDTAERVGAPTLIGPAWRAEFDGKLPPEEPNVFDG